MLERFASDPLEILPDSLVLGLFRAGPLVLAAIGFRPIYHLDGVVNVANAQTFTVSMHARWRPPAGALTWGGD